VIAGFRELTSDLLWLKLHTHWERRERRQVGELIERVTQVNPDALYFWINGARILACDVAVWRIEDEGGEERVPRWRQRMIGWEQAEMAVRRLAAAREYFPNCAELWLEQAAIEIYRMGDWHRAAESYRRAALLPRAPVFAARLHAELLRRCGRSEEAYRWLRAVDAVWPPGGDGVERERVRRRIRDIERELADTAAAVYQPRLE
jgi:hypothetical protein